MDNIKDWAYIIQAVITLIGIIFLVYKTFSDPEIKSENRLSLIEQGCVLKHQGINNSIDNIMKSINLIQENDLKHIELEVGKIKENQIKIFTILEERLPKK